MGGRFTFALIVMVVLAIVLGIVEGRSHRLAQPPAPTIAPPGLPTPMPGDVLITTQNSAVAPGKYTPQTLIVHRGTYIRWGNATPDSHSVTADNGAFNSGVISPQQVFQWTPRKVGAYSYGCFIHPDMRGTIIVRP